MDDSSLDVVKIGVVLKGTLEETCLLAEAGNVRAIVMSEHLVAHDGVGHLRRGHQIHLKKAGLKRTFGGAIVLERVKEKCGTLLHHVLLHEDINNLVDVSKRFAVILNEHLGKLGALFRIDSHDTSKKENVVRSVADLLGVKNDLLELAGLCETLNHLVRNVGSKVD